MITDTHRTIVMVAAFVILYTIEFLVPYFDEWEGKPLHTVNNLGLIAANNVVSALVLAPLVVLALSMEWGLFHRIELGTLAEFAATILLVDLLTYVMHVLFHKVPFLWRFHRMHHSDTQMDVTTGARFHIGEHAITTCIRALLFASFGMNAYFILIYETVFVVNVLFHHANITITERADRIFRIFFASPNMHKVHHSDIQVETDSNYTSLFSFWDRLFGTYRIIENPKRIVYGIKGLEDHQSFVDMQMTPFRDIKTE